MNTKYTHHIHSRSPYSLPTVILSWRRPVFPSCSLFFFIKCLLIVQGRFALVFQACICHALIKLTSPLLLIHSLSPCSLIFSSLQYSVLYYIHI
jgi:hypothetical protein